MTVVAHYIIDFGISAGNSQGNNYMMFNDPFNSGCYLPGSAEGSGGVIKVLLEASAFIPDLMDGKSTYFNAIKNTLDYLVSIQLEDGNMPTYDMGPAPAIILTEMTAMLGSNGAMELLVRSSVR